MGPGVAAPCRRIFRGAPWVPSAKLAPPWRMRRQALERGGVRLPRQANAGGTSHRPPVSCPRGCHALPPHFPRCSLGAFQCGLMLALTRSSVPCTRGTWRSGSGNLQEKREGFVFVFLILCAQDRKILVHLTDIKPPPGRGLISVLTRYETFV